jgi:hypothetical protein
MEYIRLHLSCKIQKATETSRLNLEKSGDGECRSSDKNGNRITRGTQIFKSTRRIHLKIIGARREMLVTRTYLVSTTITHLVVEITNTKR